MSDSVCKLDISIIPDHGEGILKGVFLLLSDKLQLKEIWSLVLATNFPRGPVEEGVSCSPETAPRSSEECTAGVLGLAVSSNSALLLLRASFLIRVLSVWKTQLTPDMPVSSEDAAT